MKNKLSCVFVLFATASVLSQTPDATTPTSASSHETSANVASGTKTSILPDLEKLETAASQISLDIGRLRIEKWKAGGMAKSTAQANADSVQRNLTSALPGLIGAVRSAPADLNAQFKLYRNLNALCDVVGSVTEETRSFGPKADYEALAQQLQVLGSVRRNLGESLEQLTAATQQELNQARIVIKTQQEQLAAAKAPPKEIVVAQTEEPKKPAPKKKTVAKKPAASGSANSPGQAPAGVTAPKS